MGNLIEDFLERNHEYFRSVENKLTVCVRPEGIIDREPDEMWQGFLKNMPEELYTLDIVMFNLDKGKMLLTLEVPEEELKAALEKLESYPCCFYTRVEVEEDKPVENIAAWMTVQDAMLTEINLIKRFKGDVFVGYIVRILPDRLIIYSGDEARDVVHLFFSRKHTWQYFGAGLIAVDSNILRFAHEKKNRRVYLRLQEVKYINPDEEYVPCECPPDLPFSDETEVTE